jgi:N-acetylglucosaminyl-diphospho-decaprenol L-rhamnosyltransferase
MMPVIIPLFHRPDQVERCRKALNEQTRAVDIWTHDNSENNIGFTRAVNKGMRQYLLEGHKYAVVLNQDCYLMPDAIERMVAFMDAHPRCAIAGIKQYLDADPDQIIHGGCTQAFPAGIHITGRASSGDCAESKPMPWVNGACLIVRLSAVIDFGLMDENFFLIGSDSDWCYTARLRGWEVWYCAEAECLHEWGVSRNPPTPEVAQTMARDQVYWHAKWVGSRAHAALVQMNMPPAPAQAQAA